MQRITNSILVSNYLVSNRRNLNNLSTFQNQLASGKNIQRASQDPYVATKLMKLNAEITANKQYNTNITDTSNWLDATDTGLSQMGNVLSRIKQLMVKAGNGSYSPDEIATINKEVTEDVKQLGQVLNSSFDGSYIFGGTKTTSKPVVVDDKGNISYADKNGNALPCTSTGSPIVIGSGASAQTVTKISIDGTNMNITLKDSSTPPVTTTLPSVSTVSAAGVPLNETDLKTAIGTAVGGAATTANINDIFTSYTNINQIGSDLKSEVAEGVVVNYNKTASDVLEFKYTDTTTTPSTTVAVNVPDVLNDIINNLTIASGTNKAAAQNAISQLNGNNLSQIDQITKNLLLCRSGVGAMQNRMDAAQQNNLDENENMTDVLSQVGDVDYAQKTMEYSVAQTSYTASLQVSAKVLTKTLLDYL